MGAKEVRECIFVDIQPCSSSGLAEYQTCIDLKEIQKKRERENRSRTDSGMEKR